MKAVDEASTVETGAEIIDGATTSQVAKYARKLDIQLQDVTLDMIIRIMPLKTMMLAMQIKENTIQT